MSTPYTKSVQFEATSGEDNYIPINFPHRGKLTRVFVKQIDGVEAGFEIDLFNSALPGENVESSASAAAVFDSGAYQIFPTQTTDGDSRLLQDNVGYPYRNVDGTYTTPIRKLHLRINPTGTLTKTFEITMTAIGPTF